MRDETIASVRCSAHGPMKLPEVAHEPVWTSGYGIWPPPLPVSEVAHDDLPAIDAEVAGKVAAGVREDLVDGKG
jgi:hypothetical protein